MTKLEALAVLQIENLDEAKEAFEWEVFETRKFLQQQPVFLKTHQNRIAKFKRVEDAFLSLGFNRHPEFEIPLLLTEFSGLLVKDFLHWQKTKNELRFLLNQCITVADFTNISRELIATELNFSELFDNWPDDIDVKVSLQPDVMAILQEIRRLDPEENKMLRWYAENCFELPEILRLELKRLSLLKKYLTE